MTVDENSCPCRYCQTIAFTLTFTSASRTFTDNLFLSALFTLVNSVVAKLQYEIQISLGLVGR